MALLPRRLAINMEQLFHQNGLVVNQSIPLQMAELEKNKQLKNPLSNGQALPAPVSKSDFFWICIITFTHP